MANITYLGVRHHGPGCARQLCQALDELQPQMVLIEGPSDLGHLLAHLAEPAMRPPLALLAYASQQPDSAAFWPFAEYSPEYQAMRWALAHQAELRLIDLPAAIQLAPPAQADTPAETAPESTEAPEEAAEPDAATPEAATDVPPPEAVTAQPLRLDPIQTLAEAAGYEDGESWWSDVVEENPDTQALFAAIEEAMHTLREQTEDTHDERNARREAWMRREIASALREAKKNDAIEQIVVVCGAWHVPALKAKVSASADREQLKGLPKCKIQATWAPWSAPRLARATGYGAGVRAPAWYQYLWEHKQEAQVGTRWLTRVAALLREQGDGTSTASLIEAQRLATALAAVRQRPAVGLEELREACIATLFGGDTLRWQRLSEPLLLGDEVGSVSDNLPLAPLLEDLQRQQKSLKLKPEALQRELKVDLRSPNGLARSTLLHRLNLLQVNWGTLIHSGSSRGTFRENWLLQWQPEFTVQLVEHLVYGPTLATAAARKLSESIQNSQQLAELTDQVQSALIAQLPEAVDTGLARLEKLAAATDDCAQLLASLPSLTHTLRYGAARTLPTEQLSQLLQRLIVRASLGLHYAVRQLDQERCEHFYQLIRSSQQAIELGEADADSQAAWQRALLDICQDPHSDAKLAGLAARLSYDSEALDAEQIARLLSRHLSSAQPAEIAGRYFEGFFAGSALDLVYDARLRQQVSQWLMQLSEDEFLESLPLLRRTFADLDGHERRQLLAALCERQSGRQQALCLADEAEALWQAHDHALQNLFGPPE